MKLRHATNRKKKAMPFNCLEQLLRDRGYGKTLTTDKYDEIGTNAWEFGQWVRNEKQPDLQQAAKLADLLKVDVKELYNYKKAAA